MIARLKVRGRRLVATVALIGAACIASLAFGAAPAAATANHCAQWGQVQLWKFNVPTGQYCFTIHGNGRFVESTGGSFDTGWIDNPSERVTFSDQHGTEYASFWTYQAV